MKKILGGAFLFCAILMLFGNFASAAGSLSNGVPISGTVYKSSSPPTYQFTTNKDGEVYITLDQTTLETRIILYDSYGNDITSAYAYPGDGGVLELDLVKGRYSVEIEVTDWGGNSSSKYRVKATFPSTFTRDATTFEPNDTAETSLPVSNGKFYTSTSETQLDKDVYRFTTNKDGEIYLTLDRAEADYRMYLYDQYGNSVSDAYVFKGHNSYLNLNVKAGTYYIVIRPNDWSGITSASYRLKATYPAAYTRNSTNFEPNDTIQTSMPLTSNKLYLSDSFSDVDRDVYQFTTIKDGKATIRMDQTKAQFRMILHDSLGNSITDSYVYPGQYGDITLTLKKGIYYVKVIPENWSGVTSSTYRIKATFQDKIPTVDPIYDTGTLLTGTAVSNTKVYAVIGTTKLGPVTAANGKYSIKVSAQKAGTTIGVYTVDSAGNISQTRTTKVVNSTTSSKSVNYDKIQVSWHAVPGANGYEVYRSTSSTGTYSKAGTVTSGSTVNFTNGGLTTGKAYYYKVRAYRVINGAKVFSPYTKTSSAKPLLNSPTGLKGVKVNTTSMKVSWGQVSGASGYQVYRSTSSTGTYSLAGTVTSGSTLSFTNKSLTKGKTYYYKVRAYRTVNGARVYGGFSSVLSYKHY